MMTRGKEEENSAVKCICIILFIRHALTFGGMKIISRSSRAVGIRVTVRPTMTLYSLIWSPNVSQILFLSCTLVGPNLSPSHNLEDQEYFPSCFMTAEKPRTAKALAFTKYKWDLQRGLSLGHSKCSQVLFFRKIYLTGAFSSFGRNL